MPTFSLFHKPSSGSICYVKKTNSIVVLPVVFKSVNIMLKINILKKLIIYEQWSL